MGKFRGWHILAGIAAMVLTGILGTVMGLNNTAAFMAGCVAFVGVALWTDSRISRRRYKAAEQPAAEQPAAARITAGQLTAEQKTAEQYTARQASQDPASGPAHGPALRDDH